MRGIFKALPILLFSISSASAQKKAVFIILDGIPADVIESVETPTLDEIAEQGGYSRAYTGGVAGGASETPTISAVGYNSLLTGTWATNTMSTAIASRILTTTIGISFELSRPWNRNGRLQFSRPGLTTEPNLWGRAWLRQAV